MKSDYLIQCIKEHITNMKARERALSLEIKKSQAQFEILESERMDLEMGLDNWLAEAEQQ